jgi:U4/U6.U5 tri-snRNP-associated protein 1
MAEAERTKKLNEFKIKKRDYTGYDDEEFTPGHQGVKRSVLSKYDEDIEGSRETVRLESSSNPMPSLTLLQGFRLGSSASLSKPAEQLLIHDASVAVNKSLLSIDYASEFLYLLFSSSLFITCGRESRDN